MVVVSNGVKLSHTLKHFMNASFFFFNRLKPQWVLRRDNVEEITNSLQAIQLVMDTLGISY